MVYHLFVLRLFSICIIMCTCDFITSNLHFSSKGRYLTPFDTHFGPTKLQKQFLWLVYHQFVLLLFSICVIMCTCNFKASNLHFTRIGHYLTHFGHKDPQNQFLLMVYHQFVLSLFSMCYNEYLRFYSLKSPFSSNGHCLIPFDSHFGPKAGSRIRSRSFCIVSF